MSSLLLAAANAAHPLASVLADVPNPADHSKPVPGGAADDLTTIAGWFFWIITWLGVAGVLAVSAGMVISFRRGEVAEHGGKLGIVLAGCLLATSAGPIVNAIL